ncbi:MAG: FAD-dependent monooxygenase [Blastocatellia bacterium]
MSSQSVEYAIVGAGPAGSHLAARLAEAGSEVALFDPKGAWEKPCGGGVTSRGLREYPFLLDGSDKNGNRVETMDIVSSGGRSVSVKLNYPFVVYSRRVLNGILLRRATDAGAEFIRDAVTDFSKEGATWVLRCRNGKCWRASFLVGADGAASSTRRRLLGIFPARDVALTIGYNLALHDGSLSSGSAIPSAVARLTKKAVVRFVKGFRGYLWAFPRTTEINFGGGCRLGERTGEELRGLLRNFIEETTDGANLPAESLSFFAAKIPILDYATWPNLKASGDGWALIGDAAGFVDPLTGEGIYYALKSADLLFGALCDSRELPTYQADVDQKPIAAGAEREPGGDRTLRPMWDRVDVRYENAWRSEFGFELQRASHLLRRFYEGRFLGMEINEAMVRIARVHGGIRRVMVRSVLGEQSYITLKADLLRSIPRIFSGF